MYSYAIRKSDSGNQVCTHTLAFQTRDLLFSYTCASHPISELDTCISKIGTNHPKQRSAFDDLPFSLPLILASRKGFLISFMKHSSLAVQRTLLIICHISSLIFHLSTASPSRFHCPLPTVIYPNQGFSSSVLSSV